MSMADRPDGSCLGDDLPAARTRPVRVTVDLDLTDYDTLRDFAHDSRMTHTDVLRALIRMLKIEPIRQQVRRSGPEVFGRAQ
jgi:hypothetical protein